MRRWRPGAPAVLASVWFAVGVGVLVYSGRITFLLGLALGLAALLAVRRLPLATGLAALSGLASPVAGLFTALAGVALVLGGRRREGLALAAGAGLATLALSLAFQVSGTQPFGFGSLWPVALGCLFALATVPGEQRVLRIGISIYLATLIALFVIPTPIGNNGPRLGVLFLGPLVAAVLLERRGWLLALVALPLLYLQMVAPVGDVVRAAGDPSTASSYYRPLLAELEARSAGDVIRVEVPPTQSRFEAVHVAERFPLARGWLRQLEADDRSLFFEGDLDADAYASWLYRNGISFVAVPDAELDYIADDEVDLIRGGGLPFLREVWSDEHWRLYEVRSPDGTPARTRDLLASGGAEVTALGPDAFSVRVPGPGDYLVAVRYSSYFEVASGRACLEDGGDVSTRLIAEGPGAQTIEVSVELSVAGLLRRDRACSD